jgi:hypothetical protein
MKNLYLKTAAHSALIVTGLLVADVEAANVASGYDQDAEIKAGVRYQHMNGDGNGMPRIMMGKLPVLETTSPRFAWNSGKHINLTYDATTQSLTTVVNTPTPTTVTKNVGDLGELNYILLTVQRNGHPPMPTMANEISLQNVVLNNAPLSPAVFQGVPSGAKWNVTGENLSSGFVLEGDIVLSGQQPGSTNNHIEIDLGYSDQTGPKVIGLGVSPNPAILNGVTTLRATVSEENVGNNLIVNAEYSLNGGEWMPVNAQDGAYDAITEDVEAELPATQIGSNEVCVRGTDAKGNVTTPPTCTTFLVTYQFEGFAQPIDSTLVNSAQAGQAVPSKWRLTDANGVAIDNPDSFSSFYSYPIDCESFAGNSADAVEEYSAGNSGLQYNGDGNWQYNWKTPKAYVGSCQAMYVAFDSGAISPIVTFKFK